MNPETREATIKAAKALAKEEMQKRAAFAGEKLTLMFDDILDQLIKTVQTQTVTEEPNQITGTIEVTLTEIDANCWILEAMVADQRVELDEGDRERMIEDWGIKINDN